MDKGCGWCGIMINIEGLTDLVLAKFQSSTHSSELSPEKLRENIKNFLWREYEKKLARLDDKIQSEIDRGIAQNQKKNLYKIKQIENEIIVTASILAANTKKDLQEFV